VSKVYVRSSSTKSVTLTAGGGAASVTVYGSNLERITSAQVLLNNQRATGVSATLGSASSTSRTITLSAAANAKAATNCQIRLIAGTQTINMPVSVFSITVKSIKESQPRTSPVNSGLQQKNADRKSTIPNLTLIQSVSNPKPQLVLIEKEIARTRKITIRGNNLDRITSAQVISQNNSVAGRIRARLDLQRKKSTSIEVILVASMQAEPGIYYLRLLQADKAIAISADLLKIEVLPAGSIVVIKPEHGDTVIKGNANELIWTAPANSNVRVLIHRREDGVLSGGEILALNTPTDSNGIGILKYDGLHLKDSPTYQIQINKWDGIPNPNYDNLGPPFYSGVFALETSEKPPLITKISPTFGKQQPLITLTGTDFMPTSPNPVQVIVDYGQFKYLAMDTINLWVVDNTITFRHPGDPYPKLRWNGRNEINTRIKVIVNGKSSNWIDFKLQKDLIPKYEFDYERKEHWSIAGGGKGDDYFSFPASKQGMLSSVTDCSNLDHRSQFTVPDHASISREKNDAKGDVEIVSQAKDPKTGDQIKVHWWYDFGSNANYKIEYRYRTANRFCEEWVR
jgi:uncharacterized protein (UPF0264 family)